MFHVKQFARPDEDEERGEQPAYAASETGTEKGRAMKTICRSFAELVGNTPLVELKQLESVLGLGARVLAKLEYFNPAGSVKDRVALAMIEDAEARGLLGSARPAKSAGLAGSARPACPEGIARSVDSTGSGAFPTVIEPTSGNTGIGLAAVCAMRGYRLILVMPSGMSIERRRLMEAYGAELVLSDEAKGMGGAIARAEELAREIPGSFVPGQFTNLANPGVHKRTTGPEIWHDTEGSVDIFVATVGTGGTITGVGEYLKEQNSGVKVVAVEPQGSAVLSTGRAGAHGIQGIGAGFIPEVLNTQVYDEVVAVSDEDSFAMAREVAHREGLLVGISSGAALWAAARLAKQSENKGKTIVTVFPDGGERYLSVTPH